MTNYQRQHNQQPSPLQARRHRTSTMRTSFIHPTEHIGVGQYIGVIRASFYLYLFIDLRKLVGAKTTTTTICIFVQVRLPRRSDCNKHILFF